MSRVRPRVLRSLAFGWVLLPLAACRAPEVFPKAPVVLISIDTLRADHLPAYGYRGVETPALEAFRKDAILFDSAFTHVPLTLPAHASLFTGLLPFEHGVRDNLGYRLEKTHATLASFLRARGYATGGAVSAFVLDRSTGIGEGFDFYEDGIEAHEKGETIGQVQRSGSVSKRRLEQWIAAQRSGKPLFVFLHLYEPHTPYAPPEPLASRYAAHPYDGEIAAADAIVGSFFQFLKTKNLYDRALIFVLSDHGEGLADHGEDEHGIFLYREEIRVPLLLKLPGSRDAGQRVLRPVALVDVLPTVLRALGERVPSGLPGVSLLDEADSRDGRRIYSETLYPRFHFGWSDLASLTDGRYHYIEAPRPELYDWSADPAERNDLAKGLSVPFRSLRTALQGLKRPIQLPGASDAETVRKLASLGYMSVTSAGATEKNLPDPKDRIASIGSLKEASRLASEGRFEQAIGLLSRLARESPRMLDAWETLARIARQAGRTEDALAALNEADRLQPGTAQILLGLADLSLEAGDLTRARSLAEAAAAVGAGNVPEVLASITLAQGDLAQARRHVRASLDRNPRARGAWLLLARIETQAGNLPSAWTALERIGEIDQEEKQAPPMDYEFFKADVLARQGRENEAEEAFRTEMRDYPRNPRGWTGLALLYVSQGKRAEADRVLVELVAKTFTWEAYSAAIRTYEVLGERRAAEKLRATARHQFPGARELRARVS